MTVWTIFTVLSVFYVHSFSFHTDVHEEVMSVPFLSLVTLPEKLHLVSDQFILTQTISLKPIISHLNNIKIGYVKVKQKFKENNISMSENIVNEEARLIFILEQAAKTVDAGLRLLPLKNTCSLREKRSLRLKRLVDWEVDSDAVDTTSLFPSLGHIFGWVTGTLSSEAGHVINQNFNNIKKLTKMSLKFANMINSTLSIENKHHEQLNSIAKEVDKLKIKLDTDVDKMEKQLTFSGFLQNMVLVAMDLQRTIDNLFSHTDKAEQNKMGSFARDPIFLQTISNMLDYKVRNKSDILFLMKIASKIKVSVCHWVIFIAYKFPILEASDFVARKALSTPRELDGKYFALQHVPYVVTWGSQVYYFTKEEFDACDKYTSHIFCRKPAHLETLLDSCLYGIVHHTPWERLAKSCELEYIPDPEGFIEFTNAHMVYFFKRPRYVTVICETYSKPLTLVKAGTVEIPTGCRIKYGLTETFSLGHIARSKKIDISIEQKTWNTNLSKILPLLRVTNVKNVSSLFSDISREQNIVKEGLSDVNDILNFLEFSPTAVHFTLWSLIGYALILTIVFVILLYCICMPGSVITCKRRCGCGKKGIQRPVDIKGI